MDLREKNKKALQKFIQFYKDRLEIKRSLEEDEGEIYAEEELPQTLDEDGVIYLKKINSSNAAS